MSAAQIIDRQLDAYNERDVAAFVTCYSDDCKIVDQDDNEVMTGRKAIAEAYERFFGRNATLHADVRNRIVLGEFVIDDEYVTGLGAEDGGPELHAVAIYRVRDELIAHVRLVLP